jgi:asparagine synthase (glutamine-hydrolysing)
MAGLAGIVPLRDTLERAETSTLVEIMGRAQGHRAPAGWRVLSQPGLVHVLSGHGSAPTDPAATDALEEQPAGPFIAFDGVITNRSEVREQIGPVGSELRTASDRELVRRAWDHWGEQCPDHLDGRYGFVVHDPAREAWFLVRDRFGHRPFHYTFNDDRLCFASEIKTLLSVTAPPVLDELALLEWSLYGDLLPPRTLFRDVHTLAPGQILKVGKDGRQQSRMYYDPADVVDPARYAENAARSVPELIDMLESAIEQAVVSHIDGRREVGILLSGGVDSGTIAAMAVRHAELQAYNFSILGDPRLEERQIADTVAGKLGIPLQGITLDGEAYRRALAHATYRYEMPLWHMQGVPYHLLAHYAREHGAAILLSGVSVGPLVGAATDRYRWIVPPPFLSRVPDDLFRIARKAVYSASGLSISNPFFAINLGVGLHLVDGGARSRRVDRVLDAYDFLKDAQERRIHVMRLCDNSLFLPRFFYQGDRFCMAESIEYCDAAVEARFMSLALNLPTDVIFHKQKTPKWILKEIASRHLSREIAYQKKVPLDVPIEQYFEPAFKQSLFEDGFLASFLGMDWNTARSLLGKARERRPLLFQLINLETWGRLFFMRQSADEVQDLLCR